MGSIFGKKLKISLFGESHGEGIGVVMDNFPAGIPVNMEQIRLEMGRRRPGGALATPRNEADEVEILSGVRNGRTTGAPIGAIIRNTNQHSSDYSLHYDIPRPSHSDYPASVKYGGNHDIRGGGHFSARITAPLVFAGALCKEYLSKKGIKLAAHLFSVGEFVDDSFSELQYENYDALLTKEFPVLNDASGDAMKTVILYAKEKGDSVGGIIECGVYGFPAGIGDPFFDSLESTLSHMIFSVPAVKGIEFGDGFRMARRYGSENNDCYEIKDGKIVTKTNHAGGIVGGISTGMPILFRAVFKPTASIYLPQKTLNVKTGEETELQIMGRHDPCVAVRGVPVIEAATAVAIALLFSGELES